jgi:hypothetical protein
MPRGLLIFSLCIPLAILLGYMLADPLMGSNMMVVAGAMFALLVPLALAVHHRALIWVAGAIINVFFLPGQPQLWMVIAGMSFIISFLARPLTKVKSKPVWDRWVLISLIVFLGCMCITAWFESGFGMRVLGSTAYGGRKYVSLVASIVGFIALTMSVEPRRHAQRDVSIYALGPITTAFSNLAYMLGPGFYFLFLLFPVELAINQAQADLSPALIGIKRYTGFGPASPAIFMFCLTRWGLRGIFQLNKPWRLMTVMLAIFIGLLSGFRSAILIIGIVALVQFFAEGLHRTKYVTGLVGVVTAAVVFLVAFSEHLPLAAQRAVSFLPVKVDPMAAADARTSLQWRLEMWHLVVKEIPNHLWLGKGYSIDPTDLYLADESFRRGFMNDYEIAIRAGDYHSGPLSLIVPFGICGSVAMICFFIAAIRVLYKNMRYGDAEVRNLNVFLFSFFVGRLIFFVICFGGIESDLWMFTSAVGLNLSLNGGVKGPAPKKNPKFEREQTARPEGELVTT